MDFFEVCHCELFRCFVELCVFNVNTLTGVRFVIINSAPKLFCVYLCLHFHTNQHRLGEYILNKVKGYWHILKLHD